MENHFAYVRKKVLLGSGDVKEITDIVLTRYAGYLIAQNGDPRKEEIAFAQGSFAALNHDKRDSANRTSARHMPASEKSPNEKASHPRVDNKN